MSICNPSQYECDNAERGDLVVIKKRTKLYKWYRSHFQKYKVILNIRKNWDTNEMMQAYQEDCTLLFRWELQGKSEFRDEIPYYIGFNNRYIQWGKRLKLMQFGSENISIITKNGFSLLIPTSYIRMGLNKLDTVRSTIDTERQIRNALKYARYKGDFFKNRSKELGLTEWIVSYCSSCGKPVKIMMDKEEPYIVNTCDCGNLKIKNEQISWDDLAHWFYSQVHQPFIDRYKKFWEI